MPPPDIPGPEALLEHFDWTRRLALALVREPHSADDLTQETWLSLLRSPPPPGRPVRPWLSRVMRNAAREGARRGRARADHESRAARGEAAPSDTDLAERMDLHRKLVEQVMALEPPYRRTILLRFFEGLTTAEIAKQDGVPPATVRTRLRRGIQRLRESLERKGRGDWRLALLPFIPKVGSTAPAGVLIVGTKSMLAAVAGLAALVLGLVWWGGVLGGLETPAPLESQGHGTSSTAIDGGTEGAAPAAGIIETGEATRAEGADPKTSDRIRRLQVVRDEDGVLLPGAEVGFVRHPRFTEWRGERSLGGRSDALPCIEARGEWHTADEAGRVELPIADDMSWVAGTLGDHFRIAMLSPDDGTTELRLVLDPPLRALVVDTEGNAVSGASVGLFQFSSLDASGTLVKETFTDRAGIASLHPRGERLPEDSRYRVGLHFPLASPVEVPVDPRQPPVEPIRLVAPPTGSVRVVLIGDDKEPWPKEVDLALHAIVPSRMDPDRMVRADQRDYRRLAGVREVIFEHVAVGIDVHLFLYGEGTRKDVALNSPGPRARGEEVLIQVPFTERYAWVEGRFSRQDGQEVPDYLSLFARDLDSGTRRIDRRMTVDPDGSFWIALNDRVPAGARCWLTVQTDSRFVPSLSAAFEIIAPAPGTGIDAGLVVLREAPLIVGGTVTDEAGKPIKPAWLQLGDQLPRSGGSFVWNFMGFGTAATDDEGRFELRGELLPDSYAVHARARGYGSRWTPFELGQSDLRIVLANHGGLVGHLRLPPGFPVERLSVAARPSSGEPPDWWFDRNRRVGVRQDGGFEIRDLNPGTYEIGVLTGLYSEPLAVLGTIEITPGETLAPESLADVDLTRLKVLDIEVVPPGGGTVQGLVAVEAGPGLRYYRIRNGSVSLVTARAWMEVTVHGNGYRPRHVPDLRESTRVLLEPGIPVVVTLPEGFTLPGAPLFLEVGLLPEGRRRQTERQWVYSRDSTERQVLQSDDLHPSHRFDGAKEVVLGAPAPGPYELRWWVVRPGEAGVRGSHTSPIRWGERLKTIRVEEAVLHLRTQPLQGDYEATVKRLGEDE